MGSKMSEIERYREALERIAVGEVPGNTAYGYSLYMNARKIALAALTTKDDE